MKTRLLILGMLLSMGITILAQEGSIIYKELDSVIYASDRFFGDMNLDVEKNGDISTSSCFGLNSRFFIDFDEDGANDYFIAWTAYKEWHIISYSLGEWWFCDNNNYNEGQPIPPISPWCPKPPSDYAPMYTFPYGFSGNFRYIALRKPIGMDSYLYSWVMLSVEAGPFPYANWLKGKCTIHSYAYCTIPNYPLRFGQTSLDWQVGENEELHKYSLYPNPAEDEFVLLGSDIVSAELFNLSGQLVSVGDRHGDDVYHFDLNGLSSGLYVLRITDAHGNIHSEKLMKR